MQEPAEQQRGRMRVAEGAVGVGVADAEFTAAVVQAAQSQEPVAQPQRADRRRPVHWRGVADPVVFGVEESGIEHRVVRHEHVTVEPIAQFRGDARKIRRIHQIGRVDVVQVLRTQIALHADQRLRLVLQRAVRRHMHDADLDGAVAAHRIDAGGFEVDDGEPLRRALNAYATLLAWYRLCCGGLCIQHSRETGGAASKDTGLFPWAYPRRGFGTCRARTSRLRYDVR